MVIDNSGTDISFLRLTSPVDWTLCFFVFDTRINLLSRSDIIIDNMSSCGFSFIRFLVNNFSINYLVGWKQLDLNLIFTECFIQLDGFIIVISKTTILSSKLYVVIGFGTGSFDKHLLLSSDFLSFSFLVVMRTVIIGQSLSGDRFVGIRLDGMDDRWLRLIDNG